MLAAHGVLRQIARPADLVESIEHSRVEAYLETDAVRAHESGRGYVRLHGVLHRGQRIGRIDPLRALKLLDEQAANLPAATD
ncbi:hypothetical protein [Nannocystis sp.]|uniref:hypothetical protein n=1 Tax=Nannocystis sp. TaxID=1962667 RepID=UPI0025CD8430|nr:hypothetical protein [Nannocystis sp.]MBK7827226.1 hypothetical protein [Nannocystis sp.]